MGLDWIESLGAAAVPGPAFAIQVFLLSLRLGTVLLLSPLLYEVPVPASVRVLLVVGLAVALVLGLPGTPPAASDPLPAMGALLEAALAEVAIGGILALGMFIAFAAISMAGRLIDVQIGFGIAQVFDPATRRQIPILSAGFNQVGLLVFFLLNGHHALLRGIAFSLERFPPSRPWPVAQAAPMVIKQMSGLFTLGFGLAAPVVVCLLLIELGLGVIARNLPQMNMFVIGIPLKVVVGLALLAIWFERMGDAMSRIYGFIFRSWETAFAAGVR